MLAQALQAQRHTPSRRGSAANALWKDPEWNDGAAKTQLFHPFSMPESDDPLRLNGVAKLSSMIFG